MNRTIYEVQFLRFIASSMVLFAHVQHEALTLNLLDLDGFKPFEILYWAGGVDIFFVISGFIMYYLSHDKFGKQGAAGTFFARRFVRVAPPYWAFTVAMLAAIVLFREQIAYANPSLQQIVGSFLFLPLPDPYGNYYPVLILGWTLNYEMLFYVVFAIGLLFSRPVGMTWIFAALLALGGSRYLTDFTVPPFAFWSHPIVFEFLFGIVLAHLRLKGARLSPVAAWSLTAAGFGLMILVRYMGWQESAGLTRPLYVGLPAFLICMPALVREHALPQGKGSALMKFGGDISFALYLSHPFSINLAALVFPRLGLSDPWLYIFAGSVFALIVAAASYILFEKPLTDRLNRALSRRKSPEIFKQSKTV